MLVFVALTKFWAILIIFYPFARTYFISEPNFIALLQLLTKNDITNNLLAKIYIF